MKKRSFYYDTSNKKKALYINYVIKQKKSEKKDVQILQNCDLFPIPNKPLLYVSASRNISKLHEKV